MSAALPRPPELAARALLACVLVLAVLHAMQEALVAWLLPVLGQMVRLLGEKFTLTDVAVMPAADPVVQFLANLAVPVQYAGHMVYPFGWNGLPRGGYRVVLQLSGLLQYTALLLVIVLSWPARRRAEYGLRLLLTLPLAALLLLGEAPLTVVAELWSAVRNQADPAAFCGWMVWSRFLMGGGGLLIAGCCGVAAIAVARRVTDDT